jgi:hypothetical protein
VFSLSIIDKVARFGDAHKMCQVWQLLKHVVFGDSLKFFYQKSYYLPKILKGS